MTAFAVIALDDSASAPVSFSPSTVDSNGVAHLYGDATGPIDGRRHISLGVRLPLKGSPVARVMTKVVIPVMSSEDPSIKIGECLAHVEFIIPKTADATLRADLLALTANFLADPSVEAAVEELESIY